MKKTNNQSNDDFAILYIIMRNDLHSMNTGKAIAQGSHAANKAAKLAEIQEPKLYASWSKQALDQHFGTAIVLESRDMDAIYDLMHELEGVNLVSAKKAVFGIVHDETYPIKDGSVIHHVPLDTCGYIMCWKGSKVHDAISSKKLDFPLHR